MIKVITPVIGLEIHVQLKTKSKMFCGCDANYFGSEPNTHTCPICLGLPGALPMPNKKALENAIMAGIALHCQINNYSKFDRKNYMYPDLFKGYQITQFEIPICGKGYVDIVTKSGEEKRIGITRAHQEEDTAKSTHEKDYTLIDGNKAGVPLLEIVSDPDIRSAEESKLYAEYVYNTLRFIGVSDCDMEKGQLRFDVNINLQIEDNGSLVATPIAEIKNLNSFNSMEKAIEYEIVRQEKEYRKTSEKLVKGSKTTRGWTDELGETYLMRAKEESDDYRYFTEPDLVPVVFNAFQVEELRQKVGELPGDIFNRYTKEYSLSISSSNYISSKKDVYLYFEEGLKLYDNPKKLSDWVINGVMNSTYIKAGLLEETIADIFPIANLVAILQLLDNQNINSNAANSLISHCIESFRGRIVDMNALAHELGFIQVSADDDILPSVKKILSTKEGMDASEKYKAGKESVVMYLVGLVMREMRGKGNPSIIKDIIERKLKE